MKRIMFLLSVSTLVACHTSRDNKDSTPKGYLNSPAYREYLSTYPDKIKTLESDKEFFSLIREHDFISDVKYDFYSVYLYKSNGDSILNLYSIKAKGNQCWISHRTFNEHKYPIVSNSYEHSQTFVVDTLTRLIDCDSIKIIKQALDVASKNVKQLLPKNYDDPFRITFYFDGANYYRLSPYQIEEGIMNQIDTLFRTSSLFKR
jgi:hypothetical protein